MNGLDWIRSLEPGLSIDDHLKRILWTSNVLPQWEE